MQHPPHGDGPATATVRRRARGRLAAATALATASAVGFSMLGSAPAQAAEVTHTIAQVQGTGAATPLSGVTVTVEGIVTGDHRTGGYRGLYVQTAGSGGSTDATPGASDGVFVFLVNQPRSRRRHRRQGHGDRQGRRVQRRRPRSAQRPPARSSSCRPRAGVAHA